jgi:outer membrane protein TolC
MMKYLPFIIALFTLPLHAHALSWADAVTTLENQNPTIQTSDLDAVVSGLSLKNDQSQTWPSISLRAGSQRFLQQDATLGYNSYVGFRIQWNLYQGGRIGLNKKRSNLELSMSELVAQKNRITQSFLLKQAYARAIFAKKKLEVNKNIVERSKENFRLVDLKYQSGLEYRWVWLVSKKDLAEDQLNLRIAQNEKVNALLELQQILQLESLPQLNQIEDIPLGLMSVNTQLDTFTAWDSKEHPDVVLAMHELGLAEYDYRYQQAARKPSVVLTTDLSLIDTEDEPVIPFFAAGVSLTMPVWEGGRRKRAVEIQEKRKEARMIELEQVQLQIEQEVQKSYNELQIRKMELDIAELELEAFLDRSKVVTQEYQNGLATFEFWNRTQNQLNQAQRRLITQQRDLQIQLAKFIEAKGELNQ